jgi:predicted lipid-binding transport protein (Tim44 family)
MKAVKAVYSTVCAVVAALALTMVSFDAEAAKRMGGGKSFGKQSGNVTQREATPTPPANAPAAGATQNAAKPAAAAGAAGAAAQATRKPWGAMLTGLAAGLGLAWLASSLGFGEAFAQFMLFALLALVIMMVIGFIMRKRAQASQSGMSSPYAFGGANAGAAGGVAQPSSYRPEHVGNDASARPWERNTTSFQAPQHQPGPTPTSVGGGSLIGSNLQGPSANWSVPADFDAHGFLGAAKQNFITLQSAWDRGDVNTLRTMMTDEMLAEIRNQLTEREAQSGGQPNQTDVVALDAKLLGIEDVGNGWMASVEFSGMIREDAAQSPGPFREVWNMTKPKDGSAGWLVAGLQALN